MRNRRRIMCCLFCGIRIGAIQSAFCHKDAKIKGLKLAPTRFHGIHYFQWTIQMENEFYGRGIKELFREATNGAD